MKRTLWVAVLLAALPAAVRAYPGGTPSFITDVAPYCASCHSSVSADQFAVASDGRVSAELAENKHLAKILAGAENTPYAKLDEAQRAQLAAGIRKLDAIAKVSVLAPESVKPGSLFDVTVTAVGGGGPVVGLALVDAGLRWQARPAPSAGWAVVAKPTVTGPDGKPQTDFTDRRAAGLAEGTSYVNVTGVSANTAKDEFSTVSVTWRLRAPAQPGSYPLGAVFLYGTEKGAPHGSVDSIRGKLPVGGFGGNGGRVKFSEIRKIAVR